MVVLVLALVLVLVLVFNVDLAFLLLVSPVVPGVQACAHGALDAAVVVPRFENLRAFLVCVCGGCAGSVGVPFHRSRKYASVDQRLPKNIS